MFLYPLFLTSVIAMAPVPAGGYILLNGALGAGEWGRSGTVTLDADTELRFQRDDESLFLAIAFMGPRHTGIDLYIHADGVTRMLHVSTALGERVREGGQWSEMAWGQNAWWSANVIGTIVEGGRQRFLAPEAFEFQLDRSELGDSLRLFLHLKRPERTLPAGASESTPGDWLGLTLR